MKTEADSSPILEVPQEPSWLARKVPYGIGVVVERWIRRIRRERSDAKAKAIHDRLPR
jgi:hypothetical protein